MGPLGKCILNRSVTSRQHARGSIRDGIQERLLKLWNHPPPNYRVKLLNSNQVTRDAIGHAANANLDLVDTSKALQRGNSQHAI
jgi:hypothetical protein